MLSKLKQGYRVYKRQSKNGFRFEEISTLSLLCCVTVGIGIAYFSCNGILKKRSIIDGNYNIIPKDFKQDQIKLGINIVKEAKS
jgi:hypothetical protein